MVSAQQRDQLRNDEAHKGNRTHGDDGGRDGHRHQQKSDRGGGRITDAKADRHVFAHAQHGEALRIQIGEHNHRKNDVQNLVVALNYPREITQQPALHALQHVVLIRVELGDGAQHASVHEANHRYQHRIAELDAPDDGHIDQACQETERERKQHFAERAGGGQQRERHQNPELGGVQSPRSRWLHELVAHDVLQDHAAHGQAHAGQDQRRQTRQATGRQREPGITGIARERE